MPDPRPGESRSDFISRCIPIVIDDGTAQDGSQANAICISMFESYQEENKGRHNTVRNLLSAKLHEAFTVAADRIAQLGYLDQERRIKLSSAIGDMLREFNENIDPEVGEQIIDAADVTAIANKAGIPDALAQDLVDEGRKSKTYGEKQVPKLTNERARLRVASPEFPGEACGFCQYFEGPETCEIVDGPVAVNLLCDWIQSREVEGAIQYEVADEDWVAFVAGMVENQPYQHIVKDGAITPAGPLVMIEDTSDPPHYFSLSKDFHVDHTTLEHHWSQETVDDLIEVGRVPIVGLEQRNTATAPGLFGPGGIFSTPGITNDDEDRKEVGELKGLYLADPHGPLIWDGSKSAVAKSTPTELGGSWVLVGPGFPGAADPGKAYGTITLGDAQAVDLKTFDEQFKDHRVSKTERKRWWPGSEKLYLHHVEEFKKWDPPREVRIPQGVRDTIPRLEFTGKTSYVYRRPAKDTVVGKNFVQLGGSGEETRVILARAPGDPAITDAILNTLPPHPDGTLQIGNHDGEKAQPVADLVLRWKHGQLVEDPKPEPVPINTDGLVAIEMDEVGGFKGTHRKINLSPAENAIPGYLNIDSKDAPGIDLAWDIAAGLPLPSDEAVEVLSIQQLQNIPADERVALLGEIHRVLAPKGIFRFEVDVPGSVRGEPFDRDQLSLDVFRAYADDTLVKAFGLPHFEIIDLDAYGIGEEVETIRGTMTPKLIPDPTLVELMNLVEVATMPDSKQNDKPHKTVDGVRLHAEDFASVGDAQEPGTWKLPLTTTAGGVDEGRITAAITAMQPGGFRGERVQLTAPKDQVVRKIRAAIGRLDNDDAEERLRDRLNNVKEVADEPGAKGGRRLRADRTTTLRQMRDEFAGLLKKLGEFVGWADYEDKRPWMPFRAVKLYTGPDGRKGLIVWSTNAFKDRDDEIFTTKSIEDFVDRHIDDDDKGEFWFWHIPGSKFATIKAQGVVGRFLVEAGPFDDTKVGRAFEQLLGDFPNGHPVISPEGWGASHGYIFDPEDRKDGVYEWFEKKESSVLPGSVAANPYNPSMEVYEMDKKAIAAFREIVGDDDVVDNLLETGEKLTSILEGQGVDHKARASLVDRITKTAEGIKNPAVAKRVSALAAKLAKILKAGHLDMFGRLIDDEDEEDKKEWAADSIKALGEIPDVVSELETLAGEAGGDAQTSLLKVAGALEDASENPAPADEKSEDGDGDGDGEGEADGEPEGEPAGEAEGEKVYATVEQLDDVGGAIKVMATQIGTLTDTLQALVATDDERITEQLNETPLASLKALAADRVVGNKNSAARIRKNNKLAKGGPEETEPAEENPLGTGIPVLERLKQLNVRENDKRFGGD